MNLEQSLLPTLMLVSREFARGLIGNEHRRECGGQGLRYATLRYYVQKYQGSDLSHLDARGKIFEIDTTDELQVPKHKTNRLNLEVDRGVIGLQD